MSLLLTLLFGCSDPLAEAQKANTVEAYEQYLATNPTGSNKQIRRELPCDLLVERARATKVVTDYDTAMTRCPKHREIKALKTERSQIAFAEAEKVDTAEAWKKFLDENDSADSKLKTQARDRVAIAEYGDKLQVGKVGITKVNLAGDPKGPLNGWRFSAEVTNAGDRSIAYLSMELRFLDDKGTVLGSKRYPLVAETAPGGLPMTPGYEKPLGPTQKRVWEYDTEEVPEGWKDQATLLAVKVRFDGVPKTQGPSEDN